MTTDIEARLREWEGDGSLASDCVAHNLMLDAADTIAALKAQLAEAAVALKPFAHLAENIPDQAAGNGITIWNVDDPDYSIEIGTITSDDCYRAAEALRKTEKTNG